MSSTPDMAELAATASLQNDVQHTLRLSALKESLSGTKTKEAKLREACQGFESVFLSKLFSEMRATVPKDGLLHGQFEEQYYSMFDKAMCDKMADAGGIGLADMMYRQLRGRVLGKTDGQPVAGDVLPANRPVAAHPSRPATPAASHESADPRLAAATQAAQPMAAPVTGQITSEYGWRSDPFTGGQGWHAGMDIAAAEGDPVRPCWDGKVVFAGVKGGYGKVVEVEHAGGWKSIYGHLRSYSVKEGDTVSAGGKIAEVGSTGRATGPHLHFELRRGQETVDPEVVLAQAGLFHNQP
jgi:murein DD-endopeptidase MepM/ murein hydrolase activator NlpD